MRLRAPHRAGPRRSHHRRGQRAGLADPYQIARDVELTFIAAGFAEPSDNSTVRKTRGILKATRTNIITNAQPKALTEAMVLDLLQKVWESGGIQVSETATLMCGATQKRALTNEFITKKNYREESRNAGGVSVGTIITDFGRCR